MPLCDTAGLAASIERITGRPPLVVAPSEREVRRLGLALEPPAHVDGLDALFLHRHWRMRDAGIGVLASHLPFDERLTIGYNPDLAEALKAAGISDYSIWHDPESHHLFAILTRTDDHTMDRLPDLEIVKRWWKHMADIMETDAENVPTQVPLKRVFFLP